MSYNYENYLKGYPGQVHGVIRLVPGGGEGVKEGFLEEVTLELSPLRCVGVIQEKRWDEEHSRQKELYG